MVLSQLLVWVFNGLGARPPELSILPPEQHEQQGTAEQEYYQKIIEIQQIQDHSMPSEMIR